MKHIIIKSITLTMFATLIISFVAYKSGYVDKWKPKNLDILLPDTLKSQTDTFSKQDSLKSIDIMPSSKVLILKDHPFQRDDTSASQVDSTVTKTLIFPSSKSGIMLDPEDLKKIQIDSTTSDSLQQQ